MTSVTEGTSTQFLKARIFRSMKLSTLQFLAQILQRLVSMVVLTRLLAPEIYGVFAVVLTWRYILEMVSDLGLRSLVITKEDDLDDRFLQTCFAVSIVRGIFVAVGIALIGLTVFALQRAGVFGSEGAYADPVLPYALAGLGLVAIIRGMQSSNWFAAERRMEFGKVTLGIILANLTGMVATIAFAVMLQNVWALVLGAVVQATLQTTYSHLVFRGAPMYPAFDRDAFRIIIARGKWIVGHSTLTAVSESADRLLLGLVMSSTTFGFYYIARQIIDLTRTFVRMAHGQMGLQFFGHILDDAPKVFRRRYYRYRLFFDGLSGMAAGGLVMVAPLLVDILFDDRYGKVASLVMILAPGLLLTGPLLLRECFSAQRRFRDMTILSLVSAATLWSGLLFSVLVIGDERWALVAIAFYKLPEAVLLWNMGRKNGWVSATREFLPVLTFAVGALAGVGVNYFWTVLTS